MPEGADTSSTPAQLLPISVPGPWVPTLGEWHSRGLCVSEDPEAFFPSHGAPGTGCGPAFKMPMIRALSVPMAGDGNAPPGLPGGALWSAGCRRGSARCRGQSTTSLTAERAAVSSTRFLPAAKAATRDCRARLLTARG